MTMPGQDRGKRADRPGRSHVQRVLVIWGITSVVGIALAFVLVPIVSPTSGTSVEGFANLTDLVFTVIAVPIAAFVWVFVFYSLVVFRERRVPDGGVESLQDGPHLQASGRQQVAWLSVTGGLAIFFVGWGMFGFYKQTTDPPSSPLVVDVTGQQWTWTYRYPSLGVESNDLDLPVGRPVSFRVTSDDVLHGFVVNGLGVAIDANPGIWVTAPTVTPTKIGTYESRCVELCGLLHSYMWSQVRVVSATDFASWVRANRAPAGTTGS